MGGFWHPPDDSAMEPQQFSGSAHSVSSDQPPNDPAEKVREVAEKMARKALPKPAPKRMGFY